MATLATVVALGAGSPGALAAVEDDAKRRPFCPTNESPRSDERFDAGRLVGRSMAAARRRANGHGCSVRVVKRNGEWLAVTQDFIPSRINVAVREGTVVRIIGIG